MIRNQVMPLAEECLIYVNQVDPSWISLTSHSNLSSQFQLISAQYWLLEAQYVGPDSLLDQDDRLMTEKTRKQLRTWRLNLSSANFFASHCRNPICPKPESSVEFTSLLCYFTNVLSILSMEIEETLTGELESYPHIIGTNQETTSSGQME